MHNIKQFLQHNWISAILIVLVIWLSIKGQSLERRVVLLESNIDSLCSLNTENTDKMSDIQDNIDNLDSNVSDLWSDIDDLWSDVEDNATSFVKQNNCQEEYNRKNDEYKTCLQSEQLTIQRKTAEYNICIADGNSYCSKPYISSLSNCIKPMSPLWCN